MVLVLLLLLCVCDSRGGCGRIDNPMQDVCSLPVYGTLGQFDGRVVVVKRSALQ